MGHAVSQPGRKAFFLKEHHQLQTMSQRQFWVSSTGCCVHVTPILCPLHRQPAETESSSRSQSLSSRPSVARAQARSKRGSRVGSMVDDAAPPAPWNFVTISVTPVCAGEGLSSGASPRLRNKLPQELRTIRNPPTLCSQCWEHCSDQAPLTETQSGVDILINSKTLPKHSPPHNPRPCGIEQTTGERWLLCQLLHV